MILFAFLLSQASFSENTPQEMAFCQKSEQPLRFCLADVKYDRAEKELAAALLQARRAAQVQKQEISRFSRINGGVTLIGDPVRALEVSQRAWERSYRADCLVTGLSVATGNAGTEGVTTNRVCEADRILDRVEFLTKSYSIGG